ncbi:MAG: hypothetical protein J6K62_00025 [Clostridia bacterium]|nr:hypothetical protein [Clostridia bacterium]
MNLKEEIVKAVQLLDETLSREQKEAFMNQKYDDIYTNHFGLGMWIRNHMLQPDSSLYKVLNSVGMHQTDDMSDLLLRLFYIHLHTKKATRQTRG